MRSEHSAEQSADQLQEVKHLKARIAHRGSCASPDTIFGSHSYAAGVFREADTNPCCKKSKVLLEKLESLAVVEIF